LLDSQGIEHTGVLDSEGYARVDQLYCGLLVLQISGDYQGSDEWYARISRRDKFTLPLTALQVAAESSPSGPRRVNGETYLAEARANHEGAHFVRVEVSDFAMAKKHLPEPDETRGPRPACMLKRNLDLDEGSAGLVLPSGVSYMLEIKALRAYSPLFAREKGFCALNAYHLALMSTFAYAPFSQEPASADLYESSPPPYTLLGSIGHVLQNQLGRLIKPTRFNTAGPYHLLCEEVPYSKRLEITPYDPERYVKEAEEG